MKTERLHPDAERPAESKAPRAWLVRVGCASDPTAPPTVVDLDARGRLVLGRHDGPGESDASFVTSRDRWMSRAHAEIERIDDGWRLADLGSANGTLVWGETTSSTLLRDGDVIETGSTFWLFRHELVDQAPTDDLRPDVLGSVHPDFVRTVARAERIAGTMAPVMILGETGTGKELLAQHIHRCSGREGPFLAINTAAVQSTLVASELFGVERGAHSMADRSRTGQIRSAHRGTLLLDEIGDMPLEVQVILLRVLQENEVLPVGGDHPIPIDVRFLCATHQELHDLVASGRFRPDLMARLKGTTLRLPRLAERREDLGLMVARFLRANQAETYTFSPTAYRALMIYDWPLNIRELEKAVESAVAMADDDRLELSHLPEELHGLEARTGQSRRAPDSDDERERELIRLLSAHRGNVSAVARSMGYSRMQVHRWLKQFQVDPSAYRRGVG